MTSERDSHDTETKTVDSTHGPYWVRCMVCRGAKRSTKRDARGRIVGFDCLTCEGKGGWEVREEWYVDAHEVEPRTAADALGITLYELEAQLRRTVFVALQVAADGVGRGSAYSDFRDRIENLNAALSAVSHAIIEELDARVEIESERA